jgi:hypothetical protein
MFAFSIYSGTLGWNRGILPCIPSPPTKAFNVVKTEISSSYKDSQNKNETIPLF